MTRDTTQQVQSDDEFARDLRARVEQVGPHIAVHTDAVVPAARRRRARRAWATGVGSVAVVALAAGWALHSNPWVAAEVLPAGPSFTSGRADDGEDAARSALAVVYPVSGRVATPLDEWSWDSHELAVSRTAADHFVVGCLQDEGYEARFDGPYPDEPGRDTVYGLWARGAAAGGYGGLLAPDLDDVGAEWDTDVVPPAAARACYERAQEAGLSYDPADFEDGPVGMTPASESERWREVRDEWRACLADHDVSAPRDPAAGMIPDGVLGAPMAEQVRIATIDVGCKDELGTVQQLADLVAQTEAEYVARAQEYLERRHEAESRVYRMSREYLRSADVEMPGGL